MKKFAIIIFISILFFCGESNAQFSSAWYAQYQHTTSLNFSNESRKVVVDVSGNVFVLADVTSNIDPNGNITTSTYHYTMILKYSTSGVLLNSKRLNIINHIVSGFDNKGAFGLEVDATGNIYVGFVNYDTVTDFDANISKYNTNLVRLWNHKFNPVSNDVGIDMKVAGSGDVYAIVKSVSGSNEQYHLVKANSQTTTTVPYYSFDLNEDYLRSLVLDPNQNAYITGYRIIAGFKNIVTAKIDDTGSLIWKATFNGGSSARDDFGKSLVIGVDNYIYVAGTSDRGAPTGYDGVIVKYAPLNGKKIWVTYHDNLNNNTDAGYFINADEVNYAYIAFTSSNTVLIDRIQTLSGVRAGRVAYQPLPVSSYSSLNGVVLNDMKVSSSQSFYLTGSILATDPGGQMFSGAFLAKVVETPGSRNGISLDYDLPVNGDIIESYNGVAIAFDYAKEDVYWLWESSESYLNHQNEIIRLTDFDVPSPLRQINVDDVLNVNGIDILMYPNPANDFVFLSSPAVISKIEIIDLAGKNVKTAWLESEDAIIDLSDIKTGIYVCRIVTGSKSQVKKLVIE